MPKNRDCTNCKYFVSNADVCLPDYCRLHCIELEFRCNTAFYRYYCDNYTHKETTMKKFVFNYIAPDGEKATFSIWAGNQGIAISKFKTQIKYRKIVSITKCKEVQKRQRPGR